MAPRAGSGWVLLAIRGAVRERTGVGPSNRMAPDRALAPRRFARVFPEGRSAARRSAPAGHVIPQQASEAEGLVCLP